MGKQEQWQTAGQNCTKKEESITRHIQRIQALTFRCCKHLQERLARSQRHCLERNFHGQQEQVSQQLLLSLHTAVLALALMLARSPLPKTSFFLLTELLSINEQDLSPKASTGVAVLEYLELLLFHYWMYSLCYTTTAISFLATSSPSSPKPPPQTQGRL